MSHIAIIQLSTEKIDKDNYIDETDIYQDPLVEINTDYYGDKLSETEKREHLTYVLKSALKGYAKINMKKRTITFHKKETVKKKWLKDVNSTFKQFKKDIEKGRYSQAEYELRTKITELGNDDLFYIDYCRRFSTIIADYISGYLPETLYIGQMLDAHV